MKKNMTSHKNTISAVIIAKNEAKMIGDAIKSLSFADEVLVIDTGSTDKTEELSKKLGARVLSYTTGKTFSDWRNFGLRAAKGDWILYIDGDERVSSALQSEICGIVQNSNPHSFAYAIPRSNVIFGKEFRHGGWWPDYVKRLFKKSELTKWNGDLHEEPVFEGKLELLQNYLLHIKHETVFEMVEKTNKWSAIEGTLMFEANHPPMNIARFLTGMFREFWKRMILERAFLDGKEGIIMAVYQVFSRFCSYTKLWELQISHKNKS